MHNYPKITIVTVTKNNKSGLIRAIESVRAQTYKNVEHIIVDGLSTDGTAEAIYNLQFTIYNIQFVSEADSGIYDAINKGIKLATGDVIGLLHSDDFFADENVLAKIAGAFEQRAKGKALSTVDAVYSDLVYVNRVLEVGNWELEIEDRRLEIVNTNPKPPTTYGGFTDIPIHRDNIVRYWRTQKGEFTTEAHPSHFDSAQYDKLRMTKWIKNGWMPPHPTLFIRKEIFDKYGSYRTDMKISADYEMILRLFYKYKITSYYLPITTYCMTIGGASNKSLRNIFIKSREDYRAMKMHLLPFPFKTLLLKNLSKIPQFFHKR